MAQERLIICNTSPLINLAEIDRLELLWELPGAVCISPAVVVELRAKSRLFPKAELAADSGRLRLLGPEDGLLVRSFASILHSGEFTYGHLRCAPVVVRFPKGASQS